VNPNLASGKPYTQPRRALYVSAGVDPDALCAAAVVVGCIVLYFVYMLGALLWLAPEVLR